MNSILALEYYLPLCEVVPEQEMRNQHQILNHIRAKSFQLSNQYKIFPLSEVLSYEVLQFQTKKGIYINRQLKNILIKQKTNQKPLILIENQKIYSHYNILKKICFSLSIHQKNVYCGEYKSLWASLFSKENLFFSGDIFDTPNRDAHTYSQNRILSMTILVFLYTSKQIYIKNNTIGIPSRRGGFERSKTSGYASQITLTLICVYSQDKLFIIMVMSPESLRHSPNSKEYFQPPYNRVYKICNRYKISTVTLENFGLIIDQRKGKLPLVWSTDTMNINTQDDEKKLDADKPFCCTHCGSENYTKYGKENNKQMYKCKDCNRKFVDNLYFEKLKADPNTICLVLDLYFKGVSLRKIADHLKQFYKINVYHTTVLRWIERYIEIMDKYVSQFKPKLGTVWHADEMMVSVDGDWFYLWNIIDSFTRFHLASVISKGRKVENARKAFQQAKKCSKGDRPRCIVTDGLQTYKKAINKEFYTVKKETIHIGNVGIKGKRFRNTKFDNNLVERLHGTMRDRNKTQRGLEKQDSMFIKGHQLYYNFIRPHEGLNGYTPAHFANIYLDLGENKWKDLLMQSIKDKRGDTSSDK